MKNQYFGDKRDLFKFDLLLDLMATGRFRQLSYIPMLTEFDPTSKEGLLRPKAMGSYNPDLFEFLSSEGKSAQRNIGLWREFFAAKKRFTYRAYRDRYDDYTYASRANYFRAIKDSDLRSSCVFIDPDIGVERGSLKQMKRYGVDRYLFVENIEGLVRRSENSAFIVYQHLQRHAAKRLMNIAEHVDVLCSRLGVDAIPFVRQHDLAFYAIATDRELSRDVAKTFSGYAEKHGRLLQHVTDTLHVARMLCSTQCGVRNLAVFGSVGRGEQRPDSDIDVLATFEGPATLRGFFELQRRLELYLGRRIDLVTSKALRPEMRPVIEREAMHAA